MNQLHNEECTCICHRVGGVRHFMACCSQCPICKRNIRPKYFEEHVARCKNKHGTDVSDGSLTTADVFDVGC